MFRLPALSLLLILLFSHLPDQASAQYFTLGTDPANVKWHQVKTAHFRVIFPDNMDSAGLYTANALEYFRGPGSASLHSQTPRWPVILHNRTVESNATTPYAPRRIDMLTMSPQDNYGQNWLDQLVIHEFRHAAQYASVNKGFTRALGWIAGQQAVPAVMGLFVPFWFIEGDAVGIETATTTTGRGRVPSFEMKLRAQFVEKGTYSYDKAYNGSFRDFTADWYELGYLLTGHTRLKYGNETWSRVMNKTGKIPVMMVPFSHTLFRETGFARSRLYDTITSGLTAEWRAADQQIQVTGHRLSFGEHCRSYCNLTQPGILDDGRVVFLQTGLDDIPGIMIATPAGKETVLLNPGYIPDGCLSVSGQSICWAEMKRDPRWDLQSYSVIMIHDATLGHTRKLTHKTKYFAPDLDLVARRIVAVANDKPDRSALEVLDVETGAVLSRYQAPMDHFLSYPAWSPDGTAVAAVIARENGKSLAVVYPGLDSIELLLPYAATEISKPSWYRHYVMFTGAYDGQDNIYAVDSRSKQLFKITAARFGATDASTAGNNEQMIYADYTADGYRLSSQRLDTATWVKHDPLDQKPFPLAEGLAMQEGFLYNREEIPDSAYHIQPYRRGLNLFNFHSWAPLAIDAGNLQANPGITLLSQNLLGTSFTTLAYEYDLNAETGKYSLRYSYEGWYPALDVESDYGLRRGIYRDSTGQTDFSYHELNVGTGTRVPLNWYVKSWFVGFQPSAGYSFKYREMTPGEELRFRKDRFHSLNTRLYFYSQSRRSERDIYPPWAQVLDLNFNHTLFESDTSSSIFSAETWLYFPGFARHHSFRLYGGFQERVYRYYPYSDQINIARGFSGISSGTLLTLSGGYTAPVVYPDWHAGPVLYLKRIKAGIFYDHTVDFDINPHQYYNSIGLDLVADFHLFRWFAPLEAGLRTLYFPVEGSFGFEFLYGIDLSY